MTFAPSALARSSIFMPGFNRTISSPGIALAVRADPSPNFAGCISCVAWEMEVRNTNSFCVPFVPGRSAKFASPKRMCSASPGGRSLNFAETRCAVSGSTKTFHPVAADTPCRIRKNSVERMSALTLPEFVFQYSESSACTDADNASSARSKPSHRPPHSRYNVIFISDYNTALSFDLENKKGADFRPRPASAYPRAPLLHVVVEEKLIWMRTQAQGVVLFALGRNPHVQEIAGEYIALEQEIMVLLEAIQGFAEAAGNVGNFFQFLWREFVDVLVQRFTGIDLVLNAVQPGHQ